PSPSPSPVSPISASPSSLPRQPGSKARVSKGRQAPSRGIESLCKVIIRVLRPATVAPRGGIAQDPCVCASLLERGEALRRGEQADRRSARTGDAVTGPIPSQRLWQLAVLGIHE